jgi:hypothetical protein
MSLADSIITRSSSSAMNLTNMSANNIIDSIIAILRKELNFQDDLDICQTVEKICSICMCELDNPVSYCHESHAATCRDCIGNFITHTVHESSMGLCPILWCPVCKSTKTNRVLQFPKWSAEKSFEQAFKKYLTLAQSVLTLKCKGCHTNRNLLVNYTNHTDITFTQEFLDDVKMYEIGILEINIFYKKIINDYVMNFDTKVCNKELAKSKFAKYGTKLTNGNLVDEFHFLLSVIENPERRMNLQLRFYRDYPEVNSQCCVRSHCFKCKTAFHNGKTCSQMEGVGKEITDNDIVDCPQCNISLVKGDGCNAIHCFCGHSFEWDVEKKLAFEITRFLQMYENDVNAGKTKDNIHDYCANIIWTNPNAISALKWFERHPETFFSVFKIMTKDFGMYTPHVCTRSERLTISITDMLILNKVKCMKVAIRHLKKISPKEYQMLSTKYSSQTTDLFCTMYPENSNRLNEYTSMMQEYIIHSREFKSVFKWVCENIIECKKHAQKVNSNRFMQFYMTRGRDSVCYGASNQFVKFENADASNLQNMTDYTYTSKLHNSKILLPVKFGFPISFAITGISDKFYIGVDSGSDGHYTGIHISSGCIVLYHQDVRNEGASTSTNYICQKNEVITMVMRSPLTLEIILHSCNIIFKYKLINRTETDLKYALMLPRNSSVTIINNPFQYHTEMDKHLAWIEVINMLKEVVVNINDDSFGYVIPDNIIKEATKSKYAKSETDTLDKVSICTIIDLIENNFSNINDHRDKEYIQKMSWYDVLHCLIKYYEIKQLENNLTEEDRSTEFLMENIDDPAFSAILVIHGIRKVSKREQRCAMAYMNCNSEFVEYAYQLDAENKEPVIYGLQRGCVCLPRHTREQECTTCPLKDTSLKKSKARREEEEEEEEDDEIPDLVNNFEDAVNAATSNTSNTQY